MPLASVQSRNSRLLRKKWLWPKAARAITTACTVAGLSSTPQEARGGVAEEVVGAEGGVGDHNRLQGRGVLLHHVGDAGVGVDDDLVGEAAQPLSVKRLVVREMLAERQVPVEERQPDGRVG